MYLQLVLRNGKPFALYSNSMRLARSEIRIDGDITIQIFIRNRMELEKAKAMVA